LLKWFTVRPGDRHVGDLATDGDYFANYTPQQLEFVNSEDSDQLALDLYYGNADGGMEGAEKPWVDLPGYEQGED
jgi:hypothetical protein